MGIDVIKSTVLDSYIIKDGQKHSIRRVDSLEFLELQDCSNLQPGLPLFYNYSLDKGLRFFPKPDRKYDCVIIGEDENAACKR